MSAKFWGPYLSDRQWGTVREDYSADGGCWNHVPHEAARSRAYRWGEDGLLGICDEECRLCFAFSFWNERDPILKERLFGLTGPEGNHGEDVKECYFHLDSTPDHSYMKALYKYPQAEFPYERIKQEAQARGRDATEFELQGTGIFAENRYWDLFVEYAKASDHDILIRLTVHNRGPERARLHVLPTLWFRNTWSWESADPSQWIKPRIARRDVLSVLAEHPELGRYVLASADAPGEGSRFVFTENETNAERLFGVDSATAHTKDAFHDYVIHGDQRAVSPEESGTKAAFWKVVELGPGQSETLKFRLFSETRSPGGEAPLLSEEFDRIFEARIREADEFYSRKISPRLSEEERRVVRQAYAGLLWSKQFYHLNVQRWIEGDPGQPTPPDSRKSGRNSEWLHFDSKDILSMPDKWEYPWFAAWDLAFHMIPFSKIDGEFAKSQLKLLLNERFMSPQGALPAYEFNFSDANPPVHAWACWRVYKLEAPEGERDTVFLSQVLPKLLMNFTWWVNRKELGTSRLFSGGFLGLDNISVFDRSQPLPTGGELEQADGTAWMAFYSLVLLSMVLELTRSSPAFNEMGPQFFDHYTKISDAMNRMGEAGLWDEEDGFYYDQLSVDGKHIPLKVRSLVGLMPMLAAEVFSLDAVRSVPGLEEKMRDSPYVTFDQERCLVALPTRDRLVRMLRFMLDENEFLSPFGVRSVSKTHEKNPYVYRVGDAEYRVDYVPGESNSGLFGGNSNWRGPVWFPINFLFIEALERYHVFYGDSLQVECPTGSGRWMNLAQVASELNRRLSALFLPDASGKRPCHGDAPAYAKDPFWKDLVLFYEYFHGETGRGLGASHQTGWTALVARCLEKLAKTR